MFLGFGFIFQFLANLRILKFIFVKCRQAEPNLIVNNTERPRITPNDATNLQRQTRAEMHETRDL